MNDVVIAFSMIGTANVSTDTFLFMFFFVQGVMSL